MPTASIDTFIACSLMVLLVLTAMANTSKLLYPYVNDHGVAGIAEKYREISEYILLNAGNPANWGANAETIPENFGLAKNDLDVAFDLDVDKVSRLNGENVYALSYAQAFSALGMPEVSFKLEIKPIFDIAVNLTAAYPSADEITYQFRIITEKNGAPIAAELNYYVIAKDYVAAGSTTAENGETQLNITISNSIEGPALLVTFARTRSNAKIVSFEAYPFAHNSQEPQSKGTFLSLSPLNHSLSVAFLNQEISVLEAYAFTPNYYAVLKLTSNGNNSVAYAVPQFVSASPTILVVSGLNATAFFIEWTAYPQLPIQFGADLQNRDTLSDVCAYTYIVAINSALYSCTVWLGGSKN
ncbi:MAG: hypothetical protein ACPL0C_01795 [Candidatus Bathyarchaeales archaeon]